jgi:hypothetical protein
MLYKFQDDEEVYKGRYDEEVRQYIKGEIMKRLDSMYSYR